jgi:hypothetical protein
MVRPFLTRLFDAITRTVFLVPCLQICLACAIPFPIENLEVGMTTETVREKFGAPKAMEVAGGGGGISCWTYWHEEQDWIPTALFIPSCLVVIPVHALLPGVTWDAWYLVRNSVFLYFVADKLVSWEAIEPIMEEYETPIHTHRQMSDGTVVWGPPFPKEPLSPPGFWQDYDWEADDYRVQLGPSVGDPPTCGSLGGPPIIPTGLQWVSDPSTGHPEPETSCESERESAEGRVEVGDMRYVARNSVSLWLEPTASSNEERISVNRGQPLKILARRCGWCRVEDNVGTKGWVGCVFLESKPH